MTHRWDRRDPTSLRFLDPGLEEAYRQELAPVDRHRFRVASITAAAIWAIAALVAPPLLAVDGAPVMVAAVVVIGMNAAAHIFLTVTTRPLRTQRFLLLAVNMTSMLGVVLVTVQSGTFSSLGAAAAILNFMFTFPQRIAFPEALADGVFHVVTYAAGAAWIGAPPEVIFSVFLVASAIVIGLVAIRLLEDAERSTFAQGRLVADLHRRLDRLIHQYLSPDVAQALIDDPARAGLGGEVVEVTVLFADLSGFTPFSERTPPAKVVEMLNTAFGAAVPAIFAEGGTIVQFVGDALMAIFNAPVRQPDHALRAARAGLALQQSTGHVAGASDTPRFRVGLNTGPALVGNIGSAELRNFTAIGDTTNLAARLQTFAAPGTIVMGQRTRELLGDAAQVRELGAVQLKGKTAAGRVYELMDVRRPGAATSLRSASPQTALARDEAI
ncbi:MAG TPA: adenylate/guanylate cyclase domain-containing protein [Candidatus Limnocylindrales bacterium]|nr:adenylate/guanylate cyclase domain-containing protein [Candidatus Limnocylindrales bacterium]